MNVQARKPITRALISVYHKDGLAEVGRALHAAGVEILSTGSTAQVLRQAGVSVTEVSAYTGFPEILDGRVKTLHPRIHGGVLADQNNPSHLSALGENGIDPIDLLVVNLYPFAETLAQGASESDVIEQIDIGGPTLLRAGAKNHGSVAVISQPEQYAHLIEAVRLGGFTAQERATLAREAFRLTTEYDLAIATWLGGDEEFPQWFGRIWRKRSSLRYGENPHQSAALYTDGVSGITSAHQLHGKEMSFNNYVDAEWALRTVADHPQPCVAIIKHANPCGVAIAENIAQAYRKALECDGRSAFGGVVASNREITREMAEDLSQIFTEVIVAPGFELAAREILMKKPSLRLLVADASDFSIREVRTISGGALVQERDLIDAPGDDPKNWKQVTDGEVTEELINDLVFAWRTIRSVKSNAIVLAHGGAAVGIGMGQVNRVDAARLAVDRAGTRANGCVAASDAFFPFADGVQILIDGGIRAIVQPGGSVRDDEVIAAARQAGIAMFFTGTRHFSHA